MTTDEKLAAILAAVQTDPGNRGLARDPHDNLFTACPGDFTAACRSIAEHPRPCLSVITGFFIPTGTPPTCETDGPLGALFLKTHLEGIGVNVLLHDMGDRSVLSSVNAGIDEFRASRSSPLHESIVPPVSSTHTVWLERAGPAADDRYYTMRGLDITEHAHPTVGRFLDRSREPQTTWIGIGDGGNEVGMGKVPHETVVKNIPKGDQIHCRVASDHLIVAGVSNWGAYALAAGVYVLRGVRPAANQFNGDREQVILEIMVREGPLVDGVTGRQTATVDGLPWDVYVNPLVRIREILNL